MKKRRIKIAQPPGLRTQKVVVYETYHEHGEQFALVQDRDDLYGVTHVATGYSAIAMVHHDIDDARMLFGIQMERVKPGMFPLDPEKHPIINDLIPE